MIDNVQESRSEKIFGLVNVCILTVIAAAVIYPLIFVLSASFSDIEKVYNQPLLIFPRGFALDSYRLILNNRAIWIGYRNTILYALVGVGLNLVMTTLGAYPLSRKGLFGRKAITFVIVFTMFFRGGLIPTYLLVRSLGLLNRFLVMIIPTAINVYYLIIMRTYFSSSVPDEMVDSAYIDGCNDFQLLLKIVLPLSLPIVAVMVLYYGVGHWNSYFQALIYLSDSERYPLQLVLRDILIREQMDSMLEVATDAGYVDRIMKAESLKYTSVVVSSLPMLVLYPYLQRFFIKGVMIGSLKG
jgi:putative aldouronate transport system permease protein